MALRHVPRYEDHLWYPILVKVQGSGYNRIVEMQGKQINAWNDMVHKQWENDTKGHPRGCCI